MEAASVIVRYDSFNDAFYRQQLQQQQLQQQQQQLQQQQQQQLQQQQTAAPEENPPAQEREEQRLAASIQQYNAKLLAEQNPPAQKQEEQRLVASVQQYNAKLLAEKDRAEILGQGATGTGSAKLPPEVLSQVVVPHGYRISGWSSQQSEQGTTYNIQFELDPGEIKAHGGELTPSGSYRFEAGELPDFLSSGLGPDFTRGQDGWQYKGTPVESWEYDPATQEIYAHFAPQAVSPYADLGKKGYNQMAGFMNVVGSDMVGTEIVDPNQEYVPVTGAAMKWFNDMAAAQGEKVLLQSSFMDVAGSGEVGTEKTGETPILAKDVIKGIGEFVGGVIASGESIVVGGRVPSVWGAGFEMLNKAINPEAQTPQSEYLASHPHYALGNILGEIVQSVVVTKVLMELAKAPEGMVKVKAYDEIPTSFKTQQDLVLGGQTYTRTSQIQQAGKIEYRGKTILLPEEELSGAKITQTERGFEAITDAPGSRLTTVYEEIPGRQRFLLNAEDVVDPKKKTFTYRESYIEEGLTPDFMKENRIARLDAGEDFLKESYTFEQKISPEVASGRAGKPAYGGGPTETYYGTPGRMRLEPFTSSAQKKATSLPQEIGDLPKTATGEVKSAAGGKGPSSSAIQSVLRQEGQLSGLASGQKYLPVGSQSIYTWTGRYAGAKAGMELGQYLGEGAYPGQDPRIPKIAAPKTIPMPSKSFDAGTVPKVIPPIPIDIPDGGTTITPPVAITIPSSSQEATVRQEQVAIPASSQSASLIKGISAPEAARFGRARRSWTPRRDRLLEGSGRKYRKMYEERVNPFKSILEMQHPGRRHHGRSKGSGLLWAIVTALAALFSIYFIASLLLPAIGMLDFQVFNFMNNPSIPFSSTWADTYNTLLPFLRNSFTYLIWGTIFAIIMFVIIQANRREPNEYQT